MNILLVDDDRFVVAALQQNIDWTSLGISQVFTAYSAAHAKEILKEHKIHILISDIDMPQASGLDLLSWIRGEELTIQAVFLTNYADFEYAKKAIELQSLEYYLKPIEFDKLTKIIQKAVDKVKEEDETSSVTQLFEENLSTRCIQFWFSFLRGEFGNNASALSDFLTQNRLPYSASDSFALITVDLYPYVLSEEGNISFGPQRGANYSANFHSAFHEVFADCLESSDSLFEYTVSSAFRFIAIIKVSESKADLVKMLLHKCRKLIDYLKTHYRYEAACYIHRPAPLLQIPKKLAESFSFADNEIKCRGKVFCVQKKDAVASSYVSPELTSLEACLDTGNKTQFMDICHSFLKDFENKNMLDINIITNLQMDICQVVFSFLKDRGILSHKIFSGQTYALLFQSARRSLMDFDMFLQYLVKTSLSCIEFSSSEKSVAATIAEYIDAHYSENITRGSLSEIVYLDPDYAARLFRREYGMSLVNYLTGKRISVAKELLLNTTLPVTAIADKVGYSNYSYFTKVFKKECNFAPIDFRNQFCH